MTAYQVSDRRTRAQRTVGPPRLSRLWSTPAAGLIDDLWGRSLGTGSERLSGDRTGQDDISSQYQLALQIPYQYRQNMPKTVFALKLVTVSDL